MFNQGTQRIYNPRSNLNLGQEGKPEINHKRAEGPSLISQGCMRPQMGKQAPRKNLKRSGHVECEVRG